MALTKDQLLTKINKIKNRQPQGSVKYYLLGFAKILVTNDIISPADVLAEFPELDMG